jgi:hypothetical protein
MTRRAPFVVAYSIATALIIAGLIYGFRTWRADDDKPKAAATPTVTKIVYISTDGIIENIERRLTQHQGQQMKATCPKKVSKAIGTKFSCKVYFAGRKDVIATARVKIDGPHGQFSWKSHSKVKSKPAS